MTAQTPVYGLEYIVEGEPLRNARQALENNAKTVEAALVLGGIAPPAAQDLATLSGRVTALETTPWVTMPLTNGATNFGGGFRPAQWRKIGDRIELRGLINTSTGSAVANTFATLPIGWRPAQIEILTAAASADGVSHVYAYLDGSLRRVLGSGFVSLTGLSLSVA